MKNISYIITDDGLTAIVNGSQYTITRDNASYDLVRCAIIDRLPEDEVESLFQQATAIKRYFNGANGSSRIVVQHGQLFYKGEPINNVVVDRILLFMSEGLPVEPLINFLERLLANPSRRSIEELYPFLEHGNFPITEEGFFLGYKGVNDDYTDVHSGRFNNSPGAINEMERRAVDDDFRRGCSYGFHVGTLEYACGWGPRTVIVKVDPADVVSVPEDCSFQKLRTAKYEVVADFQGALGNGLRDASDVYGDDDGND